MARSIRMVVLSFLVASYCSALEWEPIGSVDGSVMGFTSVSATQTWLCTTSGRIYFHDGTALVEQTNLAQGFSLSLRDIYALDAEHVWAVGYTLSPYDGQIYFYNGTAWTHQKAITNAADANYLYGVYASSPSHVWACGDTAQIWNSVDGGTTWTVQYDHADNKLWFSIDGVDNSNVWAVGIETVGQHSQIMRFNGSFWLTPYSEALGGNTGLRDLVAVTTNDIWAIGSTNGYVLHYEDGAWKPFVPLNSTNTSTYSISRNRYGETWASSFGHGLFFLQDGAWMRDTNLSTLVWRVHTSPWATWAYDLIEDVTILDLTPAMQRIESGIGFSWNSLPGRTYRIEWTDDPLMQTWQRADTIVAGGWTTYWGDIGDGTTNRPRPSSSTQRSYRITEP